MPCFSLWQYSASNGRNVRVPNCNAPRRQTPCSTSAPCPTTPTKARWPFFWPSFHLVFLLRLTRFLGFMPNVETTQPGYYFDLRSSDFTAEQPLHPDFLEPRDAALVPLLMRMRYDNMRFFKFSGADRSRMLEYINLYYRLHLPSFPELKSLAVLKELFRA